MPIRTSGKTVLYKPGYNLTIVDVLPTPGVQDVLYVLRSTGGIYIWDGLEYISNDPYYTNSYVERLKALGSPIQYSNYPGGSITTLNMSESTLYLTSIYINKTSTITGIGWVQQTQGNYTADNYNGVGLYSYDSINEKLVLIASTTNDGDIWKAAGGAYTNKNFSTPIVVNSGIYYIGFLHNYSAITTAPAIQVPATQTNISILYNTIGIGTAKLSGTTITHTTLPTEVLNADITSTVVTQNIYLY